MFFFSVPPLNDVFFCSTPKCFFFLFHLYFMFLCSTYISCFLFHIYTMFFCSTSISCFSVPPLYYVSLFHFYFMFSLPPLCYVFFCSTSISCFYVPPLYYVSLFHLYIMFICSTPILCLSVPPLVHVFLFHLYFIMFFSSTSSSCPAPLVSTLPPAASHPPTPFSAATTSSFRVSTPSVLILERAVEGHDSDKLRNLQR